MISIQSPGIDSLQIQIHVAVKPTKAAHLNAIKTRPVLYLRSKYSDVKFVVLSNRKQSEVPSKSEQVGRCVFLVKLNDCFGVSVYSRALRFFADTE